MNTALGIAIAFFIAQLVNVILSTLKSVLTIKGSRIVAASANAISYAINALIIKQISGIDNIFVITGITAVTNFGGVYFSLWLLEKVKKDQVWRISATVKTEFLKDLKLTLKESYIYFIAYETSWEDYKVVDVFSKNKKESKIIKEIFKKFDVKYTISANSYHL